MNGRWQLVFETFKAPFKKAGIEVAVPQPSERTVIADHIQALVDAIMAE